ncbi:transketolase [Arthrobacter sp. ISL-65]|uniref:transketolase n=1 Tax=Arthrobacter sp. ISL-65 TaxID=2819112 RepID=UPI001BEA479D|nr:transketolase [Arthrobacter sp. ISL-65]MBT2548900.1 transketolase [Arthrobacter sp. ISL-65]
MLTADASQAATWRSLRQEVLAGDADSRAVTLHERAQATRRSILKMITDAGQGHIGGDFSVTDILTVLFDAVMNVDPENPRQEDRDHFILSKGHCAAALYSTLAHSGFFPVSELDTFMAPLSALNGHPNRVKVPGVETNTGPLGHGLPVAVGTAIGAKLLNNGARVFVVTGDGEMQEGSNWEALMSASHQKLDNLTVVVDRNRLQQGARTEETNGLDPLDARLAAFGMEVRVVDGHNYNDLIDALRPSTTGSPVAVIANTIKGKGVSFIEDRVEWHHKVPSQEQTLQAFQELS